MTPEMERAIKIVERNHKRKMRAKMTWLHGVEDQTMVTAFWQLEAKYESLKSNYEDLQAAFDLVGDAYAEMKVEANAKREAELENMDVCGTAEKPDEVDTG